MNKERLAILLIFLALFGGALYNTTALQGPVLSLLNSIKSGYNDLVTSVEDTIDEHFSQQKTIKGLRRELAKYEESHLILHQVATELNQLFAENNSSFKVLPDVSLVRTVSYAKFGDTNKVWLDMEDFNASKVYGLIHKELVAGIVVARHEKPLALLNGDPKSSYAVYVGRNRAPGIVHGKNSKELIVEFIPTWIEIKPGDEVVTSGLDRLFFAGLKVGRVLSVNQSEGYQNAVVEPYFDASNPGYFHVITRIR
jgi:rod shape-determining protein MreC